MIYSSHGKNWGVLQHPKHPLVYGLGLLSMYIVIIVRPLLKPLRFLWGSVQPTDRFTRVVVRGRNPTAPTMTEYQEIAHTLNAVSRLAECVCTDCLLAGMSVWYYGYLGAILQSEMHGGNQHAWILVKIFTVPPWKYTRPYLIGNKDC